MPQAARLSQARSFPERVHPARQAHRPHGPRRTGRHTIADRARAESTARRSTPELDARAAQHHQRSRRTPRATTAQATLRRRRRPNPFTDSKPQAKPRESPSPPTALGDRPDSNSRGTVGRRQLLSAFVLRPPCSRKRPILGGHGVKTTMRVRSVSTISRFSRFRLSRIPPLASPARYGSRAVPWVPGEAPGRVQDRGRGIGARAGRPKVVRRGLPADFRSRPTP